MANWQRIANARYDRRERVAVEGGWLVKEWAGDVGRMRFLEDAQHAWDGRGEAPTA
jgi:hypothetical protein